MRITASFARALAIAVAAQSPLMAQRADSAFVGSWLGQAPITVPWTAQRMLVIRLDIHEDGRVTGRVGDAQLRDGRIVPESQIAQAMHQGGRFAVEARLDGALIRAEDVSRERVRLSLNRSGNALIGDLRTNGTYEGSPSDLMLTAKGLVLSRVDPTISLRQRSVTPGRIGGYSSTRAYSSPPLSGDHS